MQIQYGSVVQAQAATITIAQAFNLAYEQWRTERPASRSHWAASHNTLLLSAYVWICTLSNTKKVIFLSPDCVPLQTYVQCPCTPSLHGGDQGCDQGCGGATASPKLPGHLLPPSRLLLEGTVI